MEFKIAPEGIKLRDIDVWEDFYDSMERGTPIEAVICGTIRPSSDVEYWELEFKNKPGITGICYAEDSGLPEKTPLNEFAGQKILCKVNRIDKDNNEVYCGRKDIILANLKKLLNQLTQGEVINALVRVVKQHVYVDVGGGVIVRINQEKARVSDGVPLEIQYSEGDIIKLLVTQLNKEQEIIELEPVNPWEKQSYNRGDVLFGQVVYIRDNLAFVKVKAGIIGRVYYKKADNYKEGDYIKLQVSDYNPTTRRLHMKRYDARQILDRRRERARKRAKRNKQESNDTGNDIKTLGMSRKQQGVKPDDEIDKKNGPQGINGGDRH
jgi:small subunit ribosomal protein S1